MIQCGTFFSLTTATSKSENNGLLPNKGQEEPLKLLDISTRVEVRNVFVKESGMAGRVRSMQQDCNFFSIQSSSKIKEKKLETNYLHVIIIDFSDIFLMCILICYISQSLKYKLQESNDLCVSLDMISLCRFL